MPNKKRHREYRDDYDHLSRKIRKLERKLDRKKRSRSRSRLRRRHRRRRTPSPYSYSESSSREATPPPSRRKYADEHEHEHSAARSPSPVDDVILCELPSTENSPVNDENCNAIFESDSQPIVPSTAPSVSAPSGSSQSDPAPPPAPESAPEPAPNTALQQTTSPPEKLDTELLEILGEDPTSKPEFGNEIHKELSSRLEHIVTSGLSKDNRKELFDKYLVPSNCTRIAAPLLNPEIKAALPDLTLKRDKGIEVRQKQLALAITCIGQAITSEMQSKNKNNLLLKQLMDGVRMLCDIQHADSMKRRYFACSSLKKDINDQLQPTKIDKFLFGENLAETLKAAKAVSKSGAEIKVDTQGSQKTFKKPAQPQPANPKNWRPPPPARKPPPPTTTTPRTRQHAPARKPEISSRVSRPPPRQSRRQ
ncbi:hypothetical protein NE865_05878 [Phthorimaea operculella]|nr:hypothetical protein NE865_05878 [Phthorimaea operculella]